MSQRTSQPPLLHLQDLSAGYPQRGSAPRVVVQPFSQAVTPGKLICLIGPNGAGKSTLLRTLAGMQKPLGGRVQIAGQDVHRMSALERARRLSIVLTQKMEVGLFTGYELVTLGRHPYTGWAGQLSARDREVVERSIRLTGAERLAARAFNTLSDGERQKILIARALAQEPELLILDEPTAYLDLPRRVETMALLRDLARDTGLTILMSTHDLDLALRSASQIWLLPEGGQIRAGAPEDLVLSGAFEAAFRSAMVTFDIESGAFKSAGGGAERVVLTGAGVQHTWTQRALEREGFSVVAEWQPDLPEVRIDGGAGRRWHVVCGTSVVICASVEELIACLHGLRASEFPDRAVG
ncbi:MAG: ABC transporter ATP-binding protein [Chloroflexi bacterium]|nr:ABC transporter ATP-binding protein [Chloroflexota bacterium]